MGSPLSSPAGLLPLSWFPENTASGPLRKYEAGPSVDWQAVMKSDRSLEAWTKGLPCSCSCLAQRKVKFPGLGCHGLTVWHWLLIDPRIWPGPTTLTFTFSKSWNEMEFSSEWQVNLGHSLAAVPVLLNSVIPLPTVPWCSELMLGSIGVTSDFSVPDTSVGKLD